MLVNIIHPYTYKLKDGAFCIGPIEEFRERDERISEFVGECLSHKIKLLRHDCPRESSMGGALELLSFKTDPFYHSILDRRVNKISTTHYGVPLPDEKPESVKLADWKRLKKVYSTRSVLRDKLGRHSKLFFIGGIFELCVVNSMGYVIKEFSDVKRELFCIEDLCVSLDDKKKEDTKEIFKKRNIQLIDYKEALDIITS